LIQVCLFVVLLYVKAWHTAPSAPAAPFHDLTFLQKLVTHETVNKTSELAVKKFCGHLWYLGEELVPMSLFVPTAVPTLLKQKIVAAMDDEGDAEQTRRILLKPKDASAFADKSSVEFVSKNSMKLFQRLALPTSFLSKPPAEWESLEEYKRCEDFFNKLSVVNEVAERGVALSQEYLPNVKREAKK